MAKCSTCAGHLSKNEGTVGGICLFCHLAVVKEKSKKVKEKTTLLEKVTALMAEVVMDGIEYPNLKPLPTENLPYLKDFTPNPAGEVILGTGKNYDNTIYGNQIADYIPPAKWFKQQATTLSFSYQDDSKILSKSDLLTIPETKNSLIFSLPKDTLGMLIVDEKKYLEYLIEMYGKPEPKKFFTSFPTSFPSGPVQNNDPGEPHTLTVGTIGENKASISFVTPGKANPPPHICTGCGAVGTKIFAAQGSGLCLSCCMAILVKRERLFRRFDQMGEETCFVLGCTRISVFLKVEHFEVEGTKCKRHIRVCESHYQLAFHSYLGIQVPGPFEAIDKGHESNSTEFIRQVDHE